MNGIYISNDVNCPCNIKKCTSETIESCCGCPEWFKWKYDIEQSDKRNPKQTYIDLIKRLKVTEEMLRMAQFNEATSLIEDTAVAIEELKKKVDEWQETACNWNNEYYHLLDNTPRWISVEERLPEETDGTVLAYFPYRLAYDRVKTARYSQFSRKWYIGDFCSIGDDGPTHWMPLPEPPKKVGKLHVDEYGVASITEISEKEGE